MKIKTIEIRINVSDRTVRIHLNEIEFKVKGKHTNWKK